MNRLELIEKIEAVEPAVAAKMTIPILGHLWFTGRQVMAYNDGIAISASMRTDFKAAVPPLLAKLLRASMAQEVDFALKDTGGLQVKAAASKMTVPIYPPANFETIFKMPVLKESDTSKKIVESGRHMEDFIAAMGYALRCVMEDNATVPEQLGVTLLPAGTDKISIYSTNEKALFAAKFKCLNPLKTRLTLSAEFVKQMLSLSRKADSCALYIFDNSALFKAGIYTLFGKLIFSERPLDFDGVLKANFPDKDKKPKLSKVPEKMRLVLERSTIVLGDKGDAEITTNNGKAFFISRYGDSEVSDVLLIDESQESLKVKFSPALAKIAIDAEMNRMRFTKKCVVFTDGDLILLVTAKV